MKKLLACCLLLALAAPLWAAKVKGEKLYAPYDKIVLVAADVTSPDAQYLWDVTGDVQTVEAGDTIYIWAAPGRYAVTLTAVDFVKKKIERAKFSFTVGDPPPPPPPPPGPVSVPDVGGMTYAAAKAALSNAGLAVAPSTADLAATVTAQTPQAYAGVKAGSVVTLTLAAPPVDPFTAALQTAYNADADADRAKSLAFLQSAYKLMAAQAEKRTDLKTNADFVKWMKTVVEAPTVGLTLGQVKSLRTAVGVELASAWGATVAPLSGASAAAELNKIATALGGLK